MPLYATEGGEGRNARSSEEELRDMCRNRCDTAAEWFDQLSAPRHITAKSSVC